MEQISVFESLGFFRFILIAFLLVVLFLIGKKTYELYFNKNLSRIKLKWGMNSIPFWGGLALSFGALYQIIGFFQAIEAIIEAGDISPSIVIQGFLISFASTFIGLLIFVFSVIAWRIFKSRYNYIINKMEEK